MPSPRPNPRLVTLRCSLTGEAFSVAELSGPAGLCRCCPTPGRPLLCEYEGAPRVDSTASNAPGLTRFATHLPVVDWPAGYADDVGATPVVPLEPLGEALGVELWAKLEGFNPTGSFKDRGLAVAIALGTALGARRFALPTQGNAGVSAAAFSARLGLEPCLVVMPESHRGGWYHRSAARFGAEVRFAGANIAAAGAAMREACARELARGELVDVSTFFEPGRLEGKKTLGLEILADFVAERGALDAIVYPTGGGTGLVGIARAFAEHGRTAPALVAVQSERCAPVVEAFERGDAQVTPVTSRGTRADGLDVPAAIMGHGILAALRASGGHARTVREADMEADLRGLSHLGLDVGYEAAATLTGLRGALADGRIAPGARVLLLFTSGGAAALDAQR